MGGFEHYTVIKPPDSRGVKELVDSGSSVNLTLRAQRTDNVLPLHVETFNVDVTIDVGRFGTSINTYVGTTTDGSTITLTVFVGDELDSTPARVTLVRSSSTTP